MEDIMAIVNDVRLHPTRNDLSQSVRESMIDTLNQTLADLSDLHGHAKQAHWNVRGMEFIALHELFDTLAEELDGHIDAVAERVTALGGTALGTVRMAARHSRLPEFPLNLSGGKAYTEALADRYGAAANLVRKAIDTADAAGDMNTADLFTEIGRDLDKRLWFLEAHLSE
ncbi:MAG: DNA starvation/stationary phase protection protein Dps [Chloroflexi bacterium]|nr:DNA starvation/stationary phase protection protein Dps [Chloroflexota bacterium]MDL1917627.1 DNA starvation/stationary phase protection protein Dps [Anaerolineae bacterium CFX4]